MVILELLFFCDIGFTYFCLVVVGVRNFGFLNRKFLFFFPRENGFHLLWVYLFFFFVEMLEYIFVLECWLYFCVEFTSMPD